VVIVGVIFTDSPVPAGDPLHETVYHFHEAPVPNVPPASVRVIAVPEQTVEEGLAVIEVGSVDTEFILTETV
jgi:hypothetical protein